jgi:ABC-type amino acid transport substrate-binding protein
MRTLVIGADPFPPYQYIDNNGNIRGSDYETVKSIIDKMGYTAKYIIDEWSTIEEKFMNKEIDIVFQVQKTPEREKHWFFSHKLRDAITSIVTRSIVADEYNEINDLLSDNAKIGVIQNYQYGELIDSIKPCYKNYFRSLEELLDSVISGETKFGVVDLGVFNYLNKDGRYNAIKVLSNLNFKRPLYVAFNDKSLRDEFNKNM